MDRSTSDVPHRGVSREAANINLALLDLCLAVILLAWEQPNHFTSTLLSLKLTKQHYKMFVKNTLTLLTNLQPYQRQSDVTAC